MVIFSVVGQHMFFEQSKLLLGNIYSNIQLITDPDTDDRE